MQLHRRSAPAEHQQNIPTSTTREHHRQRSNRTLSTRSCLTFGVLVGSFVILLLWSRQGQSPGNSLTAPHWGLRVPNRGPGEAAKLPALAVDQVEATEQQFTDAYHTWLERNGVQLNAVRVCHYADMGRGLCAQQEIEAYTELVSIPRKLIMTSADAVRALPKAMNEAVSVAVQEHGFGLSRPLAHRLRVVPSLRLAMWIVWEFVVVGMKSFWKPFLDVLPLARGQCSSALCWTAADLLLLGDLHDVVVAEQTKLRDIFDGMVARVCPNQRQVAGEGEGEGIGEGPHLTVAQCSRLASPLNAEVFIHAFAAQLSHGVQPPEMTSMLDSQGDVASMLSRNPLAEHHVALERHVTALVELGLLGQHDTGMAALARLSAVMVPVVAHSNFFNMHDTAQLRALHEGLTPDNEHTYRHLPAGAMELAASSTKEWESQPLWRFTAIYGMAPGSQVLRRQLPLPMDSQILRFGFLFPRGPFLIMVRSQLPPALLVDFCEACQSERLQPVKHTLLHDAGLLAARRLKGDAADEEDAPLFSDAVLPPRLVATTRIGLAEEDDIGLCERALWGGEISTDCEARVQRCFAAVYSAAVEEFDQVTPGYGVTLPLACIPQQQRRRNSASSLPTPPPDGPTVEERWGSGAQRTVSRACTSALRAYRMRKLLQAAFLGRPQEGETWNDKEFPTVA